MRILSGRWAGRDLVSPGGRVRPTGGPLREEWLSRLDAHLSGARVVDLFAGTGALGLEALSRGARSCDFVENGAPALHALKANVAQFRLKGRTRIFRRDALTFTASLDQGAYDICFADPPYTSSLAERIVRHWLERPFASVLSIEHAADIELPQGGQGVSVRRLVVDDSAVTFYRARL